MLSGGLTLTGDTVRNNSADSYGGAVYVNESGHTTGAISFTNTSFTSNSASGYGGAMYIEYSGPLSISGSTISNNLTDSAEGGGLYLYEVPSTSISGSAIDANSSGSQPGGGIYASHAPLSVTGSTFSGDSAGNEHGGAIYASSSNIEISASTFSNDSGCCGGAIYVDGTSAAAPQKITQSSFSENRAASDQGGAIFDYFGDLIANEDTFANNGSSYYGGAIYYDSGHGMELTNDTFEGNHGVEGGAIYLAKAASTGSINLLNDTIIRNVAYEGGGIAYPQKANSIRNTIVAENTGGATSSGGGDCYQLELASAEAADKGGNLDSDRTCFSGAVFGNQIGLEPLLGTLAANGGPTATDALLTGSPARAHGVEPCPATDQRGVPRPSNACDVGAFQTGVPPTIALSSPANGAAVDTATLGTHTFTVEAADSQFASATASATYTVVASPAPAPAISALEQSHKRWREGSGLPKIARSEAPLGTTFSFKLNEAAGVTFSFVRRAAGRRVHRSCRKPIAKLRDKPRCTRSLVAGALSFAGHAGSNSVAFAGRINRSLRLPAGSYTLLAVAQANGKSSGEQTLSFTITKR